MRRETSFAGYWRVYGGITSLIRSTYFLVSLGLAGMLPRLHEPTSDGKLLWPDITLQIFPSLLGFALGGMAIMLAFSSGRFLEAIRQKGKDDSYFRKVIASFFHFAVVLTGAIIIAFISKFYVNEYISLLGVFLTFYGVLLILSIVSRVWHTARIFNQVREISPSED